MENIIVTFHKNMRPEEYSFISKHFTGVVIKAEAIFLEATLGVHFSLLFFRVRTQLAD